MGIRENVRKYGLPMLRRNRYAQQANNDGQHKGKNSKRGRAFDLHNGLYGDRKKTTLWCNHCIDGDSNDSLRSALSDSRASKMFPSVGENLNVNP